MPGRRRGEGRASRNIAMRAGIKSPDPQANPMTPALQYVYAATEAGKITHEEGKDLNPNYNPEKKYNSPKKRTQRGQYRQYSMAAAGFKPNVSDTHLAYKLGHITSEEAKDLNPEVNLNKQQINVKRSGLKASPVPRPQHVAAAQRRGHITSEEADDLNPDWIRNTGRARAGSAIAKMGGKTPSIKDVHAAVSDKHISTEEGTSLNPKFDPSNSEQQRSLRKYKRREEEAAGGYGKTPALTDIHRATTAGHINNEEAMDLNPRYATASKYDLNRNASRQFKGQI